MEDVVIIGGGAAGLACGIEAGKRGRHCLILEQKEKIGKKLYATGNGKCNFANRAMELTGYHCVAKKNETQISQVMMQESCLSTEQFMLEAGIPSIERQGYVYPRSEQAAALVHALEAAYLQTGGAIKCGTCVRRVAQDHTGKFFCVETDEQIYQSRRVVLATGGTAASKFGSDGSGYAFAKMMDHTTTPCLPALCGLKCKENGWNRLQGVRAKGTVTLLQDGKYIAEDYGEIQFTRYGVSGIVIFNLSRYAAIGLHNHHTVILSLDLLTEYSARQAAALFRKLRTTCAARPFLDVLSGFLPEPLARYCLRAVGLTDTAVCRELTDRQLEKVAVQCKSQQIEILGTNSFEEAQVTAGGVPLHEINLATMESKKTAGCYLVGELLDVDGICGGYNLMWAWETGRRAGRSL